MRGGDLTTPLFLYIFRKVLKDMAESKKQTEPEILVLDRLLTKGYIPHEMFYSSRDECWHLYYPSMEDWRLVEGETVREGCCSVLEGPSSLGGDKNLLEMLGLLTDDEAKTCPVRGGMTAEDICYRILLVEGKRREEFHRFATCEGTEIVSERW
jgi:hypothetical protein